MILEPRENKPPERNGPTARPAAERVWARPFKAPRTAWLGAEFVIWVVSIVYHEILLQGNLPIEVNW